MKLEKLCKKAKNLWLVRNAILFLLITVASVITIAAVAASANEYILHAAVPTASVWFVISVLLFIFPSLKYKYYAYSYDEKRVLVKRGVIFRHQVTIPVCQIQDIHYIEGPITMMFGLGSIEFSTAGSNFVLEGLSKEDAHRMIGEIEVFLNKRIEEKRNEEI